MGNALILQGLGKKAALPVTVGTTKNLLLSIAKTDPMNLYLCAGLPIL